MSQKLHDLLFSELVEDFTDLAKHRIVDVVGDDMGGRKIIVVSACRFPANKTFDNQRFLRYFYNHFCIVRSYFYIQVPDGHPGQVCGHGLQLGLLPPWHLIQN